MIDARMRRSLWIALIVLSGILLIVPVSVGLAWLLCMAIGGNC